MAAVRVVSDDLTDALVAKAGEIVDKARGLESGGKIVLSPQLRARPAQVLDSALRAFAGYHTNPVLGVGATDLVLEDTRLLFYYQNRLAAHGLAFDAIRPRR